MNPTKVLCQLCESKDGELLCESCKRIFIFCSDCFRYSHQSDNLSAHKTKAITADGLNNLIKNGYLCKDHHEERYTLMCKTCNTAICSDCAILGKHRTHKVISANEYLKNFINTQSRKLESVDLPYEDIAKCVAVIEEVYGKRKSFVRKSVDVVEQLFKGILVDIAKNRQSMLQKFEDFEQQCLKRRDNLIATLSKMMDTENPIMKTIEELKEELGALVKIWREKYAEAQNEIVTLETTALNGKIKDIALKPLNFADVKAKYSEVRERCMNFKQQVDVKSLNTCPLVQVCQRLLDNKSTIGAHGSVWNTASSLAFSNCLSWHCYVMARKLPTMFRAKLRLNSITSAAGDWTHAIGITDDYSLKQRIRPTDYAILFNTSHVSFTPNFESAKHEFKNHDVITITVNSSKEMRVQINNEMDNIPFQNLKGDFYLFCSLYGRQQEVEIIDIAEL